MGGMSPEDDSLAAQIRRENKTALDAIYLQQFEKAALALYHREGIDVTGAHVVIDRSCNPERDGEHVQLLFHLEWDDGRRHPPAT